MRGESNPHCCRNGIITLGGRKVVSDGYKCCDARGTFVRIVTYRVGEIFNIFPSGYTSVLRWYHLQNFATKSEKAVVYWLHPVDTGVNIKARFE